MEAETRELMRATLRELVSSARGGALLDALAETGWYELLAEERASAVGLLFEEQGRSLARSPALDAVVLDALGREPDLELAFVYPSLAGRERPAATLSARRLALDGIVLSGAERAKALLLPALAAKGAVAFVRLPRDAAGLSMGPFSGLDPELGWACVWGEVEIGEAGPALEVSAWEGAVAAAHRALAHELTGVAEAMLAIGVDHVKERRQFGRAIGTFQSVKHRLADVQVAVTASRLALEVAWAETDPLASALAKAQAGRAALLAARHVQQVCGAIGWTWEHGLHRFVRRAHVLDAFLGSSQWIQTRIGERLLEAAAPPRIGGF